MDVPELLFVGSGRWVMALDRYSGRPVWRRKLPRFFGGLVTLVASEGELYVARSGYVYALDSQTGEVLWERGVGSGSTSTVLMTLSGLPADQNAAAMSHMNQAAAAGAAAGAAAASAAAAG